MTTGVTGGVTGTSGAATDATAEVRPRGLVVDLVPLFAHGIVDALASAGLGPAVVTRSAREALRACAVQAPEVLVVGRPHDLTREQVARRLRGLVHPPCLVALVDSPGPEVPALLRAGAAAVLLRSADVAALCSALERARHGDVVVEPALATDLGPVVVAPSADETTLSAREREVLALLVDGRSNREIAATLFVGDETVKSHLGRLYAKLGVHDRRAAVRVAAERGFLRVP